MVFKHNFLNMIKPYVKYKIRQMKRRYAVWRGGQYLRKRQLLESLNSVDFEGKRVAIVGSADSAFKSELGKYIDGFDIVVRINKGVEMIDEYSDRIGSRTDVLFHSFNFIGDVNNISPLTQELWEKHDVKKLVCGYNISAAETFRNQILQFFYLTRGKVKAYQLDLTDHRKNFDSTAPYYPTNGFIAINTVFNFSPKELYITGITFFRTPHNEKYRAGDVTFWKKLLEQNKGANHNVDREYQFVKNLYTKYPEIVKPDATLKEIFDMDFISKQ